ncbi:MAG TPA: glycosyl hydrolase family 65 protein, partial [Micavibrio sp.]
LNRAHLSGRTGPGLDACAAIQVMLEMEPGEEQEIIFRMGVVRPGHGDDLSGFIRRFRGTEAARAALDAVHAYWRETLDAVQIETPDQSVNILANGWLLYQTVACRMWARSGYYQSGGAFGFRDQLQDAMALVHTRPELLRDHLLLCARHQFVEGDVQHWWHPPSDRGVRTKCSDDYLWLPLAVSRYVEATNDTGILEEIVPFIEGRQLHQEEDSYYDLPIQSAEADSLYQHCIRAIMHGLRFGAHGLPLIGSCDWNDGMDKVGEHGQGESVWLAFFLYDILLRFAEVATWKDDVDFAERCRSEAKQLRENIGADAWDGAWYRRAYFDDGTPLGSSANEECQIDSLSQSWAVLSGAGSEERARQGMESADARLVRRDRGLVQLLDPPFDKSSLNPGYIRGYVPGVRENGGQYTHAAIWMAMAFAELGDRRRTWEILEIVNPLNHGRTPKETALYKAEPYVIAADVYGEPPHTGRGGWTWYTGSAGWMYRLILENLLGLRRHGAKIVFSPCLPPNWSGFKISYRYRETLYEIEIETAGQPGIVVDGEARQDGGIPLLNDGNIHKVKVFLSKTGTF